MSRVAETRTGGRAATQGVIPGDIALSVGNPGIPAPHGWKWTALTEVARLETGHTPSRSHPEYWGGDVPWVGIRDATENHGRSIHQTIQYTNDLGIANSSARILPAETVCLSRTASVGYVVVMGRPMATSQDFVNWVCGDRLDWRFLKYVLLAETASLRRFAYGTTHQTIYFPEVKAFHVLLPPVEEQRRISDVLSALDDKIEVNRRICATLEEIACTLFRSWFVNFEPVRAKVRAKADGRDPVRAAMAAIGGKVENALDSLPAETYESLAATVALFPGSMVASELGEIPAGWMVKPIGDCCEVVGGGTPSTLEPSYWDGEIAWATPRDMSRLTSPVLLTTERKITAEGLRSISSGLLPVGTVLMSSRAPIGYLAIADIQVAINQGFIAMKPNGTLPSSFLLLWARHNLDEITSRANGSTFLEITRSNFRPIPVMVPSAEVIAQITHLSAPIFTQIAALQRQCATLASTKDALLPRLLSGDLMVPDAD